MISLSRQTPFEAGGAFASLVWGDSGNLASLNPVCSVCNFSHKGSDYVASIWRDSSFVSGIAW